MDSSHESSNLASATAAEQANLDVDNLRVLAPALVEPTALETSEAEAEPDDEPPATDLEIEPSPSDTLSASVRRLVRQYDLDITGVHGTGPSGRIRVSDVIGMLGGRADPSGRPAEQPRDADERTGITPYRATAAPARAPAPAPAAQPAAPATTVFECDLSRVLSHRKQQRRDNVELLLTSYYLVACAQALKAVPEVAAPPARLGVSLHASDGGLRTTLIPTADDAPLAASDDRLRELDRELRAVGDADLGAANLLIHHYGLSGSLLATPTPLGAGHAASLGIGRVRREVVVKNVDGDEAPRIAAACYVTLTFLPDRIALNRANRFLAQLVRALEQWPE